MDYRSYLFVGGPLAHKREAVLEGVRTVNVPLREGMAEYHPEGEDHDVPLIQTFTYTWTTLITGNGAAIQFFCPASWTMLQAMEELFRYYNDGEKKYGEEAKQAGSMVRSTHGTGRSV